jgi:vacuolar-type H+-ATPase subunit I/STV1
MKELGPFREWLREQKEIDNFYNIDLKVIEERILISEASVNGNIEQYNIKPLFEALIEPHKIKINTNEIDKLNKEFKNYNIVFKYSENEIKAYYNKQEDIIYIIFKKDTAFNILEALIGHEMVHREQHKRAGEDYFKQSEKVVKEINDLRAELKQINMSDTEEAKRYVKLLKVYNALLDTFLYLTPYESMAYAYQFVKEYKNIKPQAILDKMKEDKIKINNITKKYVAMYWLIKDKI